MVPLEQDKSPTGLETLAEVKKKLEVKNKGESLLFKNRFEIIPKFMKKKNIKAKC